MVTHELLRPNDPPDYRHKLTKERCSFVWHCWQTDWGSHAKRGKAKGKFATWHAGRHFLISGSKWFRYEIIDYKNFKSIGILLHVIRFSLFASKVIKCMLTLKYNVGLWLTPITFGISKHLIGLLDSKKLIETTVFAKKICILNYTNQQNVNSLFWMTMI